jgi:hypothetical protein
VDGDKNIKLESKEAFLSLPEEEAFKYFDIFKKSLSGSLGKNLINMEFPLEQEMPEGTQHFLMKLKESKLQDDMLLEEFYQKVIENYSYGENYYIILIHGLYDVPGKSSDGIEMFDASDEVYEHILCCICPVNLSKAGLSYNSEDNRIEDRIRDWIVDMPAKAFLFPVFNDRSTDIHGVLYYTKKPEELQPDFVEQVLGATVPMTAKSQKETFQDIVTDTLGEDCEFEIVKNIHENLQEMIDATSESPDPLTIGKYEIQRIFEESGATNEQLEVLDKEFKETVGEHNSLVAANVVNTRTFDVKTPDVVIKVNPQRVDLLETRLINGRPCLIIPVDDHVEVNGVHVRTLTGDLSAQIQELDNELEAPIGLESDL